MSSPSKKAARASLILVLGATSAIPAVAALTSNDQPPVVIASAASADATQQLTDQILGRDSGETTSYAREGRQDNTRRQNRQARRLERRALDAYFGAGYDYDHAVQLAEYWGYGDDVYSAKITKGKVLLGTIDFPPAAENPGEDLVEQALDAYFDAGYDYDHAVELAEYWGYDDAYTAKITKGKFILGAIEFPPAAGEEPVVDLQQQALDAYFEAGYDYDDAVVLAEYWGYGDDAYSAKITKGKYLLGAIEYPPAAGEEPVVDLQQQALDAYFEAGYDYDDAVALAEWWGYGDDVYSAKITKGKVLLGVIEFPPPVEDSDDADSAAAED